VAHPPRVSAVVTTVIYQNPSAVVSLKMKVQEMDTLTAIRTFAKNQLPALALMLCLALCAQAQQHSDAPYTFRGNTFGVTTFQEFSATLTPEQRKQLGWSSGCLTPNKGTRHCTVQLTFTTNVSFVDDKLAVLDFFFNDAEFLDGYVKALTEKFATPKMETHQYQNRMGASYPGRIWTWENSHGEVSLEEFGHNLECGTLTYYDKALLAEFNSRRQYKPEL